MCMNEVSLSDLNRYQTSIDKDPAIRKQLLNSLSITVTSMFRDPLFFLFFKQNVIPRLKTYPSLRIWIAGCSTGEEVYSIAILLKEAGILDKCTIYATDFNILAIKKAKNGIFPISVMRLYSQNYFEAGGEHSLSDYYKPYYNNKVKFDPSLAKNIVWTRHNLATDSSFNEFNVILCRNVLIYFNKILQNHVHKLFYDSLTRLGILGLGSKERIEFTSRQTKFDKLDERQKFYRKIR